VSVDKGHFISLKANKVPDSTGIGYIDGEGRFNLHGNCMSLLYGDNAADYTSVPNYAFYLLFGGSNVVNVSKTFLPATTLGQNCYNRMFSDCSYLIVAPELPATTLANNCYYMMFLNCPSLTTVPSELPALTLANYCYRYMFSGCSSLVNAPELPALTLVPYCYYGMFTNCSKLNYIKMLATDISASNCLGYWLNGVASSGTFVKNPAMKSLPTGTGGVPSGWTVVNDGEESDDNLITFTINGTEYQAEEGMTFYDWAISEYYDNSCNLVVIGLDGAHLRDNIINGNVSLDDSLDISYSSVPIIPHITTDTIIQPISYMPNFDDF
jgi:hypothetical protein